MITYFFQSYLFLITERRIESQSVFGIDDFRVNVWSAESSRAGEKSCSSRDFRETFVSFTRIRESRRIISGRRVELFRRGRARQASRAKWTARREPLSYPVEIRIPRRVRTPGPRTFR